MRVLLVVALVLMLFSPTALAQYTVISPGHQLIYVNPDWGGGYVNPKFGPAHGLIPSRQAPTTVHPNPPIYTPPYLAPYPYPPPQ